MLFDVKKVREDAEKEFRKEREKEAKSKIIDKLKELEAAKKIVRNLEAELKVIEADIAEG